MVTADRVGWQAESVPITFVLCDLAGKPVVELPMVSWSVADPLSAPGDADLAIDTTVDPSIVGRLQPWEQTIIMLADGQPVWGGTVVKRRTSLGKTVTQIGVRSWAAWLDRVWTTAATEYAAPATPEDAGLVIYDRFVKAQTLAAGYALQPPFGTLTHVGVTGVPYDGDFEEQDDETAPRSILAEVGTVVTAAGVDWDLQWRRVAGKYEPFLRTFRFDATARARAVVVGTDTATATLEIDTNDQAGRVKIVGESTDVVVGSSMDYLPLWRAFSFDQVVDVDTLAAQLLAMLDRPILTVSDVAAPGTRADFKPGDLMQVSIPQGFDTRYPDGAEETMRVTGIKWAGGSSAGETTSYTLAALWQAFTNTPDQQNLGSRAVAGATIGPSVLRGGLVQQLRDMQDRIRHLELRRPTP